MDPVNNLTKNFDSVVTMNDTGSKDAPKTDASSQLASKGSKFQWKLDAPEFVPRFAVGNVQPSSSATFASSAESTAEQNDGSMIYPLQHRVTVSTSDDVDDRLSNAVYMVDCVVEELKNTPESFDDISSRLLNFLHSDISNKNELMAVFTRLLEAALTVENFSFICIRLMIFLHDNYDVVDSAAACTNKFEALRHTLARDCLLDCLENEFEHSKMTLNRSEDNKPRLFTFAHVLCTFSTMLTIDGKPIRQLVMAIYELLERIASQRSDAYVRFSIQILKTVGAHLESAENLEQNSTPHMDALIDLLECIGTEENSRLLDNTKFMIRNLRGVRRHWAYVAPPPPSPIPAPACTTGYDNQLQVSQATGGQLDVSAESTGSNFFDLSSSSMNPYIIDDPYACGAANNWTADMQASALYFPPPEQYAPARDTCSAAAAPAYFFTPSSLTPAETAFFEGACADAAANSVTSSAQLAAGGSFNGSASSAALSDDDQIADAYEDFLRNFHQRHQPGR